MREIPLLVVRKASTSPESLCTRSGKTNLTPDAIVAFTPLEWLQEFHISRRARKRYGLDRALFAVSGNCILADFHSVRLFAQRMNQRHDLLRFPELAISAGQLNAMGLIDEILHFVLGSFLKQAGWPDLSAALVWLEGRLGRREVDRALLAFVEEFPPVCVYDGTMEAKSYLEARSNGTPNRATALEEMLMLWIANTNPAFAPFVETLFDDGILEDTTSYLQLMSGLHEFFDTQRPLGLEHENLIDLLRAPARACPHSLGDQLEYIREHWGISLGKGVYRVLSGLDLIREELKPRLEGPVPSLVYEFKAAEAEADAFSADLEWMAGLVLIAKSTYVWLHQLSCKYKQDIRRLDQVPDQELEMLAGWGITGLWLIGVWERSPASKRIKELCGSPEPGASAYSIMDYEIAPELGGEDALQDLKDRASRWGIRLASDMVPNHMGIYSRWIVEHPDWFTSLDRSPFPSYTFGGPDLSCDDRVGIYLEDHYYDRSDAAVVFKRLDRWTGDARYVYHGNDGTRMPWNDTAQLDYIRPDVREAVIQTILHVARKFQIVRFDAAMTLTRRHYQRLWYPEPGTAGDIPSRAGQGMPPAEFDDRVPSEFWREVVDRVAAESSDVLLLAEAFWLMEGYFVRSLGMHRVYNSAFMNMLRTEDNAGYRSVVRNVLAFNPEILKRFVNFMNNPDEETAIAQFGNDDKYFGVCTMMVTMPGLPMFGHGQVEGLTERYGMEYHRPRLPEEPDPYLLARHESEIFPLVCRRTLFSEVHNFRFYDFENVDGTLNEDVFAYSNGLDGEHVLVAYHNRYRSARGRIKTSVAYVEQVGDHGAGRLTRCSLGEALGLPGDADAFVIFRNRTTGLEHICNCWEIREKGLYLELDAYKYCVLDEFRRVVDDQQKHYRRLEAYTSGRGVPSIEEGLREVFLQPVRRSFDELVNVRLFEQLMDARTTQAVATQDRSVLDEAERRLCAFLSAAAGTIGISADQGGLARIGRRRLEAALSLPDLERCAPFAPCCGGARADHARPEHACHNEPGGPMENGVAGTSGASESLATVAKYVQHRLRQPEFGRFAWATLLGWIAVSPLGMMEPGESHTERYRSWVDEWALARRVGSTVQEMGADQSTGRKAASVIRILVSHLEGFTRACLADDGYRQLTQSLFSDAEARAFLEVNRYGDVLWFGKEAFSQLLWWFATAAIVEECSLLSAPTDGAEAVPAGVRLRDAARQILDCYSLVQLLLGEAEESGYRVERMLSSPHRS